MSSRSFVVVFMLVILSQRAEGQKPVIFAVDKTHATLGEVVTIVGSDFGTDPAKVRVFFGATQGQIKSISNQTIEALTPAGATLDRVSVTNTTSGLTGYAPGQFFPTFHGQAGLATTGFSSQSDFQAEAGLYDLCICDFNADGKPDVGTASTGSNFITIFQNTSTVGTISLAGNNFLINARTLHVKCGDLNGDGRPDIALTEAEGDRVFILTNTGNLSFSLQSIRLAGRKVKRLVIADLDMDGKPEIVISDSGGNVVSILPNISTISSIMFGTPVVITISQALSTDALEISDMNADGLPEIITSQYQADNENKLFVALNGGNLGFSNITVINVNKAVSNLRIGDLDGDSRPDIAVTRLTGSDVSVYFNQSDGNLSFGHAKFLVTEQRPVGLDLSDLDGDGRLDISVATLSRSLSLLNNTGAPGAGSFAAVTKLEATYINRAVRNADMDGDGKTDIVFASVDDFSGASPVPASKISLIRNTFCMLPRVTPSGPLEICSGYPLRLKASVGTGVSYEWFRSGSPVALKSGTEPFLDVTTAGEYYVTAISEAGACSRASNTVAVQVSTPGTALNQTAPDARSNSPVCTGNTLNLEVNDVGASEYRWRGPDGFSQSTTSVSLARNNFRLRDAGLYVVDMLAGGCVAKTDSLLVESVSVPEFSIVYDGGLHFCEGSSKNLQISPATTSGFSYQWYETTAGPLGTATSNSYAASASGEYYAVVTSQNPGCQPTETGRVTLTAFTPPAAAFQVPAPVCAGNEIFFTQNASVDPRANASFQWNFGDGNTSTEKDPVHVFTTAKLVDVKLTVSYNGAGPCSNTRTSAVQVLAAVKPDIQATAMSMCAGELNTLAISDSFTSIQWNTSATTTSITTTTPGEFSVTTSDQNGCTASDQITITAKDVPVLEVSADKESITAGQRVQLTASGADTYLWTPGKTLNDSTLADPQARPLVTTTYVVKGQIDGGCSAEMAITIQVSGESISIVPPVLFSPNGDDTNEFWVIEGVENYPDCALHVFDKRGTKVFESTGYNNNWNATYQGTSLPEGVYYFVFGCPDKKTKTGTVTVIR